MFSRTTSGTMMAPLILAPSPLKPRALAVSTTRVWPSSRVSSVTTVWMGVPCSWFLRSTPEKPKIMVRFVMATLQAVTAVSSRSHTAWADSCESPSLMKVTVWLARSRVRLLVLARTWMSWPDTTSATRLRAAMPMMAATPTAGDGALLEKKTQYTAMTLRIA